MGNPSVQADQERVLGVLLHRGLVSAAEMAAVLGKSQPSISRVLASLASRVLPLGSARARRYGLPQLLRGLPARQALWWTDAQGQVHAFGTLSHLVGGWVHVQSEFIQSSASKSLPWFLAPLRAQGFLGRLHAQRLQGAGLAADPERWDLESTLFAALMLHDVPGAITVGESARVQALPRLPAAASDLAGALDALAQDVAATLPAGSSAGGEQPKFLAQLNSGQPVLVKFSPPRGTPFGERWHDLLWAEGLAGQVLGDHGVPVARAQVVASLHRSYLLSERFDRTGAAGRRHVVSVGDAHAAFVADAYSHWAATAADLARQGRLSRTDAQGAAALLGFGRLIGNTDMHSGNLGLLVGLDDLAKGRFRLAPVYDMLPMRWKPNPELGGAADYAPFDPEISPITRPALGPATDFWARLARLDAVSAALRAAAAQMHARLALAAA
jgi:HipA-like C-terminal domain